MSAIKKNKARTTNEFLKLKKLWKIAIVKKPLAAAILPEIPQRPKNSPILDCGEKIATIDRKSVV